MRYGVIVNPTSGKNTGAQIGLDAVGRLRAAGAQIVDLSALDAAGALARGRAAIAKGEIDTLVVAGGDGMVHLGTNLCAGTAVPLGIIAAGTGNDIARELGLPVRDAAKSVERILAGRTRAVDAVRHERPTGESAWFVGVIAAGFDAIVNERANGWRWPKGRLRYDLAIMRELPVFRPIPYVLELDGERIETEAMLVAVGNGPAYGGGMQVVPDARSPPPSSSESSPGSAPVATSPTPPWRSARHAASGSRPPESSPTPMASDSHPCRSGSMSSRVR